jgi:hypothetical protein
MDVFGAILKRVEQKKDDYAAYGFEKLEMAALNTFFDLAQEYDSLETLYMVSVTVPRVFFGLQSNLYRIDPKTEAITWEASSHPSVRPKKVKVPDRVKIAEAPYQHKYSYVVPIHGKKTPASHILCHSSLGVIGIFEVTNAPSLTDARRFFIQKYVNRIGYNMYNKFLAEQNIKHLKFINNLVADIEHNVIVPNIRYKSYFKKIRRYLTTNKEIERDLENLIDQVKSRDPELYDKISEIVEGLVVVNRAIFRDQEEIEQHYKHASLFLETLFRADHFLFGEYILRKTSCYLWQDIMMPQLERYRDRFVRQGIVINHIMERHKVSEDLEVRADKGLMAQVVANLFLNAAKYARSVEDASGERLKKVDCRMSLTKNFFGRGHHGVRADIFSSGPPIEQEDAAHIFDEGFRLKGKELVEGTGHGLYFVKNVVEVHGGVVGHHAVELGNEFYFVLPA